MSTEPVGQRNADLLRAVHDQHATALLQGLTDDTVAVRVAR